MLVALVVDLIWVLFLGGFRLELGGLTLRSTTLGFPVAGILATLFLLLLVQGKGREAVVVGSALFASGLLAEAILRVLNPSVADPSWVRRSWYRPSDRLGQELVPGFEGLGPGRVPVRINSHGLRDEEHAWEKAPGVLRVLGIGDSFTFGWGVSSEETFLKRLEPILSAATGRRIETINAGVPGWGLNQYYLYLRDTGLRYSPDVVVLAYFVDDLSATIEELIPADPRYQVELTDRDEWLRQSRLYNLLTAVAGEVRFRNRHVRVGYLSDLNTRRREWEKHPEFLLRADGEMASRYRGVLSEQLNRLTELARERQAALVLMLIPDVAQLHHPELQHVNHILAEAARGLDLPLVDVTPMFEQTRNLATYYFWPHDLHTNPSGHALMARALREPVCAALEPRGISCGLGSAGSPAAASR